MIRKGVAWAWLAALTVLSALPALADPPPAPPGIASSLVDFRTGIFAKVLPFDVKVQLYGEVAKEVTKIDVHYLETTNDEDGANAECRRTSTSTWTRAAGGVFEGASESGGSKIFRINLGPLKARHFYTFCFFRFESIDDETAAALRSKAKAILDEQFSEIKSGDFKVEQLNTFRTRLRKAVEEIFPDKEVEIDESSFLTEAQNRASNTDELKEKLLEFRDLAEDLLTAQLNSQAALNGLSSKQDDLGQRLAELNDNAALGRAVDLLRSQAQSDAGLAAFADGHQEAFNLLALDNGRLTRLALGLDPEGTDEAGVSANASAEQVAAAERRYGALSANVRPGGEADGGLGDLVEKIVGANSRPALRLEGLTVADKTAVQELLQPAGLLAKISGASLVLANQAARLAKQSTERTVALAELSRRALEFVRTSVTVISGTTAGNFDTFQRFFASADIGLMFAPDIDQIVPHLGANIYLRPVNPNATLAELRRNLGGFSKTFSRRFSLSLALTATTISETDSLGRSRDDLFSNQSLLIGAGYRLTDVMRLGIGGLIFKQGNPNPLVDGSTVKVTPYLTLSFDAGFAKSLNGFGTLFGGGSNN